VWDVAARVSLAALLVRCKSGLLRCPLPLLVSAFVFAPSESAARDSQARRSRPAKLAELGASIKSALVLAQESTQRRSRANLGPAVSQLITDRPADQAIPLAASANLIKPPL
jgi:hypothetical protein